MDNPETIARAIMRQQQFGLSWEEALGIPDPFDAHLERVTPVYSLPNPVPDVIYSESSLELEHERQARRLTKLFAQRLNMSEEEYIKALPSFPDMPRSTRRAGARPLIVEGLRIPWREQATLSGINVFGMPENWQVEDIITVIPPPQEPFTTWVFHFNARWVGCEIKYEDRRPSIIEGIAYSNAYAGLVAGNLFWLLGSPVISKEQELLYLNGHSTPPSICSISEEVRRSRMPAAFSASFTHLFMGRNIRT